MYVFFFFSCYNLKSKLIFSFYKTKQIFGDYHHLQHSRIAKRSIHPADESHHVNLTSHPEVVGLAQQKLLRRVKRDFIPLSVRSRDSTRLLSSSPLAAGSSISGYIRPRFDDPKWPQMWYLVSKNSNQIAFRSQIQV